LVRQARFEHLIKSIRLNVGAKSSSATIRLNPPELGRMRIDLRMAEQSLQVKVEVATPRARELITARANELVTALREHGIQVERFEVAGAQIFGDEREPQTAGQELPSRGREMGRSTGHGRRQERHGRSGRHRQEEEMAPAGGMESYAGSEARLDVRI
jgi:flagellar hook-length control protein FliK